MAVYFEPVIRAFYPKELEIPQDMLAKQLVRELVDGSGKLIPVSKRTVSGSQVIRFKIGAATFGLKYKSGRDINKRFRQCVQWDFWGDRVPRKIIPSYDRVIEVAVVPSVPESLTLFNNREECNAYIAIIKVLMRWKEILLEDAWECRPFDYDHPYEYLRS